MHRRNADAARAEVAKLVDKFDGERNRAQSEADVRAGYVDLLFQALGWNVFNDPGQITNYRREGYVRGAGFVDVGLELRGQPVLFLEAKRFGRIPASAQRSGDRTVEEKQAFRYARGKSITYAILTNFERLHVFNADHERLIYAFDHPQDYLRNFEALWRLSPAEVERGSLPWWEGQFEKKDVDLEFLAALRRWRLQLANAIHEHNVSNPILLRGDGSFDFDRLMAGVQRILDRLILIRYGDDKEVLLAHDLLDTTLAEYRNRGAYARSDHLMRAFADLSHMMDQHHNTTLFAPGHICELLAIPNQTLAQVIEEMNGISFRKFTSDILGSTHESYLGTKLALRNGRVEDEERRDVRKGRGIYYTPRWVVQYIVDNTLGRRLKELEEEHGLHAIQKVRGLAVLDPACGSGSFLIYAYQVLAEFYRRLNDDIAQEQARLVRKATQLSLMEHLEEIRHLPAPVADYPDVILREHLFGVDLDPEAAEIAAVNLTMQAFADSRNKKLPVILNENIKVGNSLISGGEAELSPYFGDRWREKRPFNWAGEFPAVMACGGFDVVLGNPPYVRIQSLQEQERDYFRDHFETSFGSFDLYILFIEQAIRLLKQGGRLGFITSGKFLRSTSGSKVRALIRQQSAVDMIIDLSALQVFGGTTTYPTMLILRKGREERLLYYAVLHETPQPEAGGLGNPADRVERRVAQDAIHNGAWPPARGEPLMEKLSVRGVPLKDVARRIFQGLVTGADKVFVVEKRALKQDGTWTVFSRTTQSEHELEPGLLKPVVIGSRHVHRYSADESGLLLLFPYRRHGEEMEILDEDLLQVEFPRTWEYLSANRARLEQREMGKHKGPKWYRYGRTQNLAQFDQPKLMLPYMTRRIAAHFDSQGILYTVNVTTGGYCITLKEERPNQYRYLMGILNSALAHYWMRTRATTHQGGHYGVMPQHLSKLPIRVVDFDNPEGKGMHSGLLALVDRMLELHRRKAEPSLPQSEQEDLGQLIASADREIDGLVYDLYGLAEEERRLVEEAVN
ncbi:MAG: N-6 DNA methylase [Chloroflexi bacterium]|nr:N-6 DNA methylase [Chloroflexota bacterium]